MWYPEHRRPHSTFPQGHISSNQATPPNSATPYETMMANSIQTTQEVREGQRATYRVMAISREKQPDYKKLEGQVDF